MKRLTSSCDLTRIFTRSEHTYWQSRQMVITSQDADMVGNEQQRNHRLANPQFEEIDNSTSRSAIGYHGGNSGGFGDAYSQSNNITSRSAKLAETKGMKATAVKPDVPPENSKPCPDEYNVQKARIHASLWQQEIKKQFGESTSNEGDGDSGIRENSVLDCRKSMPEDWESFDPSEGHYYEENPSKEETMMLEEFQKRRERNRIKIASFVKEHLYGRRRPVDGWKYVINNFGKDEKGTHGSVLSREGQTTGNDLEKLALKRETGRLRRKA